ncbi:MAG: hypothetical protein V3R57_09855 [Candidatus Bathyarchaeia archaeon]
MKSKKKTVNFNSKQFVANSAWMKKKSCQNFRVGEVTETGIQLIADSGVLSVLSFGPDDLNKILDGTKKFRKKK